MKLVRPLLGVVAIGLVAFGLYRRTHPGNATPVQTGDNLTFQVHAVAITNNLQLGEFTVPAKSTHDVTITADEAQMRNARLLGEFTVPAISTHDVTITADEAQMRNAR